VTPGPKHPHHPRQYHRVEPYAVSPSPSEGQGNFLQLDTFLLLLLLPEWDYYDISTSFWSLNIVATVPCFPFLYMLGDELIKGITSKFFVTCWMLQHNLIL